MDDVPQQQPQHELDADSNASTDSRTDEQKEQDRQLAERLSALIENANSKCTPLCKMIRKVLTLLPPSVLLLLPRMS